MAGQAIAHGAMIALGGVCLLQYAYYLYRMKSASQQSDYYMRQIDTIEQELDAVEKDRTLSRLENHVLREFVTQTDTDRAIQFLLRQFAPNTRTDFAAFIRCDRQNDIVVASRGLSEPSQDNLCIGRREHRRLRRQRVIVIEGEKLHRTECLTGITRSDRGKIRQLFLIATGPPNELDGLLMTTSLFPSTATREQQIELAGRLMQGVSGNLQRSLVLADQQDRLRLTDEMLQLRAIVDRRFESPSALLEEFLDLLRQQLGAARAALHLTRRNAPLSVTAFVRCGETLQAGIRSRWETHEDQLANLCRGQGEPLTLDAGELKVRGIETLIAGALVAPLVQDSGSIGTLCFTSGTTGIFDDSRVQLAGWAAGYLSETILRVLNQAVTERQARQDGLTELANRREFDQRIDQELKIAEKTSTDCALLLIDLDRFKSINDTYGHQAGDEVLRKTAQILKAEAGKTRACDHVLTARYGGEEMVVLLPGMNSAGALRIAEAIRAAVESETFDYHERPLPVTLSVGVATFPEHAADATELIAAADAALYQAKATGRNRVVCTEQVPV